MSQVAVIAKIPAAPGKRDELIAALQPLLANAETEEGTLRYILHEDTKDENIVWFYETYTDQAALTAHGSSEAFKTLGAALAPFVAGRPELTYLKPIGGKGL
jgi:quinol monooxygenase YgiN